MLRNRRLQWRDDVLLEAIAKETSEFFSLKLDLKKLKRNVSVSKLAEWLKLIKDLRDLGTGK